MGNPVNADYTQASGTSMATPHVTASAALLLQQHPGWNAQQIRDALTSTAKPTGDPVYQQGAGVADVPSSRVWWVVTSRPVAIVSAAERVVAGPATCGGDDH
jgi:subtilisin family serine protease